MMPMLQQDAMRRKHYLWLQKMAAELAMLTLMGIFLFMAHVKPYDQKEEHLQQNPNLGERKPCKTAHVLHRKTLNLN